MKKLLLSLALLCGVATSEAKVTLPSLLQDNAVLQQNETIVLWGWGEANKKLTVRPSWTKQKYMTDISAEGAWEIEVETTSAGGPYSISFSDGEVTTIENIMLGEVWLCFGQSNMHMVMKGNGTQPVEGSMDAILQADSLQPLRYHRTDYQGSLTPMANSKSEWLLNAPRNVPTMGATPYFFGRYLQSVLRVPVGVVECAWGGSSIEAWMSEEMLKEFDADYEIPVDEATIKTNKQQTPTMLYNGMLKPLQNMRFKGAIWYQGEANLGNREEYPALFKILVESLREDFFDCGEFPLYYAQLVPYANNKDPMSTTLMMMTQAGMVDDVERTGMVVLSDIGEAVCIHPRHKETTGKRFAYWALGDAYGYNMVHYRAPEYNSMKVLAANNSFPKRVALNFKYAGLGLSFADANVPSQNFEVAGEDQIFYPATARIGSGGNHIELWSDEVEDVVAVRYCIKSFFIGDVYNNFGIPISPFRTDDWAIE